MVRPGHIRAHLCLVREADGKRSVGLHLVRADLAGPSRAFLIEPEGLQRLKEVVAKLSGWDQDDALAYAFDPEVVASNLEIARMLSAIPDMDGEVIHGQLRFRRLPVPNDLDALPPRPGPLTIVLVPDWPLPEVKE
jgi:hypothetical protein